MEKFYFTMVKVANAPLKNRGFTLVELSIVLVIIGLIVGGVLVAQSLIHIAELRRIAVKSHRNVLAIHTFRLKYSALPGDMLNAHIYWGAEAACTNEHATTATGCNGDGDGLIEDMLGNAEDLRAVQFLALAGFIEGSYTGRVAASGNQRQLGVNVQGAIYKDATWWINHLTAASFGKVGNRMSFGAESVATISRPVLTTEESFSIDEKLDDGKVNSGLVVLPDSQVVCYNPVTYDYLLNDTTVVCSPQYWLR